MHNKVLTIGYSTRGLDEFIGILKAHSVELLVDVRTIPRSRNQPDFNEENLERRLKANRIAYLHDAGLGGLRKPERGSVNTAWRNASFRGFADYMQTREFRTALLGLIRLRKGSALALMCAEGNPFRCHRSLIADALLARKVGIYHISSGRSARPHAMTSFAKLDGTKVTYPG